MERELRWVLGAVPRPPRHCTLLLSSSPPLLLHLSSSTSPPPYIFLTLTILILILHAQTASPARPRPFLAQQKRSATHHSTTGLTPYLRGPAPRPTIAYDSTMPSSRRVKLFSVAAITAILLILYLRSTSSYTDRQTRYLKALVDISDRERLLRQQHESLVPPADHSQDLSDSAGVAARLKAAEDAAKKAAADKAGPKPDSPRKVEDSRKAKTGAVAAAKEREKEAERKKGAGTEEAEEEEVYNPAVEIAEYLKRAPIVIFSKSYCPYSQRAKRLLLDTYNIEPAPLVVELDQHAHGAELQAALGKQTGRRTVPNILVAGKSIGGCDDVYALEEQGALHDTIKRMGGKRVRSVARLVKG